MIAEAQAAAAGLIPDYLPEHVQFLMLVIQGLLTIVVAGVAWFLRNLYKTLEALKIELNETHKELLKNYATKEELSKRVHGLRDTVHTHTTWLHLIAMQLKINLPQNGDRRTGNDS